MLQCGRRRVGKISEFNESAFSCCSPFRVTGNFFFPDRFRGEPSVRVTAKHTRERWSSDSFFFFFSVKTAGLPQPQDIRTTRKYITLSFQGLCRIGFVSASPAHTDSIDQKDVFFIYLHFYFTRRFFDFNERFMAVRKTTIDHRRNSTLRRLILAYKNDFFY